jgi:hypothetical protein
MSVRSGKFLKGRVPNPAEIAALWPTPTAYDWNTPVKSKTEPESKTYKHNLKEAVLLFPTPDTRGFTNSGSLEMLAENAADMDEFFRMAYRANAGKKAKLWGTPTANDAKNSLTGSQTGRGTLTAHVAESLWPTPSTHGIGGGTGNWEQLKKKASGVEEARKMGAGNGGQLNPDWVEALMGYPQGWTDINREAEKSADYPARWLDGTWEDGIPRTVSGVKNRVSRLRCLGNAVVPQIPAALWRLVMNALDCGELKP